MTVRYATREIETHPGRFPDGLDTPVEDVYKAQGEEFFAPAKVWVLTIASPYSGEIPKVAVHRTRELAKAAMEADVRKTVECEDPKFDAADLVQDGDDCVRLGDEIIWRIGQTDLLD